MSLIHLLLFVGVVQAAVEQGSSHLVQPVLQQCYREKCLQASSALFSVSFDQKFISGSRVTLKIVSSGVSMKEYQCDRFNYFVASQFIICENTQKPGASVTISSDFNVKKY